MKQIPEDPDERRRVVVYIPHGYVLALFKGGVIGADYVRIPKLNLPESARVISVHECPERDAFMLIVQDENFDPCRQGKRLPELRVEWEEIKIAKDKTP